MSISEASAAKTSPSKSPLAWPVVGGKGIVFGDAMGADEDLRALQRIGTKSRFARNETIFAQGETASQAYKVVSGVVRLCRHMPDGRRHIAQFSFPGDFFSVLEFERHLFTAEAVTDVVLINYPQGQLAALGEERPSVRRRFLTLLSQRLCDMENHLTVLSARAPRSG